MTTCRETVDENILAWKDLSVGQMMSPSSIIYLLKFFVLVAVDKPIITGECIRLSNISVEFIVQKVSRKTAGDQQDLRPE